MATARYSTTVQPQSLVSATQQGTLHRFFRQADANGHVSFYAYELPYDTIWVIREKRRGENFWRSHETISVLEAVSEDRLPPDDSSYHSGHTGLED